MNCKTCEHWKPKKAGEMAKHHMAPCDLGPSWRQLSPGHHCDKHKPASPQVQAARISWLKKEVAQ